MAAPTIASGNKKYTAQPVRRGAHNRAPVMRRRGTRSRIVGLSPSRYGENIPRDL
jgi:hypothetical protein